MARPIARPDVEAVAELPRQAGRGIAGVALGVDRAEDVRLQPGAGMMLAAAIAELEIGPAFARAAKAEPGADGMGIDPAEHFLRRSGGGEGAAGRRRVREAL